MTFSIVHYFFYDGNHEVLMHCFHCSGNIPAIMHLGFISSHSVSLCCVFFYDDTMPVFARQSVSNLALK